MPETIWLVVNHTIRLKGIKFSRSQAGPQERTFRSGLVHFLKLQLETDQLVLKSAQRVFPEFR